MEIHRDGEKLRFGYSRTGVIIVMLLCAGVAFCIAVLDDSEITLRCHSTGAGVVTGTAPSNVCTLRARSLASARLWFGKSSTGQEQFVEIVAANLREPPTASDEDDNSNEEKYMVEMTTKLLRRRVDGLVVRVDGVDHQTQLLGYHDKEDAVADRDKINAFLQLTAPGFLDITHEISVLDELIAGALFVAIIYTAVFVGYRQDVEFSDDGFLTVTNRSLIRLQLLSLCVPFSKIQSVEVTTEARTRRRGSAEQTELVHSVDIVLYVVPRRLRLGFGWQTTARERTHEYAEAIRQYLATHGQPAHRTAAEQDEPTNPTSTTCVVCMENRAKVVFFPCKHVCTCNECSGRVSDCPMCRAQITQRHALYM